MKLSSRKEKIIEAVVDSYIKICEPISSGDIQKHHLPSVSSATIRNELSALEDMGFLVQPHSSSGRIPTAEGYRLYVEKLMPKRRLTSSELKIIDRYFNKKLHELDDILKYTAKVISEITNLTSVAYVENAESAIIEKVKIIKLTDKEALFIIVTNSGIIKDALATIQSDITDEFFDKASNFITTVFYGKTLVEAATNKKIYSSILSEYEQIFSYTLKILKHHSTTDFTNDVIVEGSSKILDQPEYANVQKAKAMLQLLDAKEELIPVLQNSGNLNLNVVISKDNEIKKGLPECAVITANYEVKGMPVAKAGVIGPLRMDYPKVISVLNHISKSIQGISISNDEN